MYENLKIALKYVKVSKGEKNNLIKNVLKRVGLDGYNNKKTFELSVGEQQRGAIARIILKSSKIILTDEPTGYLDIDNRNKVISLLGALNKE